MFAENKILIAGLGNIGDKYADTRHNIGFRVVDSFAFLHGATFQSDQYGYISRLKIKNKTVVLLKPSTYMNLSGRSILYHFQKEKIEPVKLLVISDDLALPFGQVRIRKKGGAGGHNGLQNIIEFLESSDFSRVRIGIGNQFTKGYQSDYVLSNWSEDEISGLKNIINHSVEICESFTLNGIDNTMNRFNGKIIPGFEE